jgi:hypothetical protein
MCLLVQKEKLIQSVIEIEPRNQDRELDALPTTPWAVFKNLYKPVENI